jgi:hydroxymethylpyrimidine/phosphomethylpyrimidine kinase
MVQPARARRRRPVCAVSIAASDSGGGAGIQADLLTFAAHRVYGATVLAGGTAQNTRRVSAIEPFSTRFLTRQIDAVFSDLRPAAVKIGMLFDGARIHAVANGLRRHRARNVVLDPVMVAKTGARLLSRAALGRLRTELLPACDLVTPNIPEAEALAGIRIRRDSDRRLAAGLIVDLGARAVLIKGGHAKGNMAVDMYRDALGEMRFAAPRIETRNTHGTGCTLSSAIAAELAKGVSLREAVATAKAYLTEALRHADALAIGKGRGPVHHFHEWWERG